LCRHVKIMSSLNFILSAGFVNRNMSALINQAGWRRKAAFRTRAEHPITLPSMTSTNSTYVDYLKPWAIFFVITFVAGTVAGAILGGVAGGILGALGAPQRLISFVGGTLGFLVSLPISYFGFRFVVAKFFQPKISPAQSTVEPLKAAA
jgi:hypothetical protein